MGVTLFAMVVGRLPLFNPDYIAFMDDLVEKEIVIPTNLSPDLQYPFVCCDTIPLHYGFATSFLGEGSNETNIPR